MMRTKFLLGYGLGGSLLMAGCTGAGKAADAVKLRQPNVIFIVADDLGYGDMSCYGAKSIATPHVDSLAASGLRFTDAHSVAATSTPWHLGMGDKAGTQDWNGVVTPGPRDLGFDYSYLMAATGDRVPCVWIENQRVANYDADAPIYVSYKEPFAGEPLGKDHPELLTKLKPYPNHGHNQAIVNGISRIGYMKGGGKALWQDENIADTIAAKAVRFIENHKDTTFFLYVGTNDIHVPRYPHARFAGKSGMGYRGDAILQFDWTVGEIMKALKKQGIVENTMIVLTSDNGPVVNDGYQDQAIELLGDHRPWGELRGGKYSIFEAGTRVPFIVSWPAKVIPGVSDALKEGRDYVVEVAQTLSVSDGEWKYISPSNRASYSALTRTETGCSEEEQLYNLREDIGEKRNLAAEHPEIVEAMRELLEQEKAKGFPGK